MLCRIVSKKVEYPDTNNERNECTARDVHTYDANGDIEDDDDAMYPYRGDIVHPDGTVTVGMVAFSSHAPPRDLKTPEGSVVGSDAAATA
jgi:hypothetical protein